jgi:hypothetical protein
LKRSEERLKPGCSGASGEAVEVMAISCI